MMRTIRQAKINLTGATPLEMPIDREILTAQIHKNQITVWVMGDWTGPIVTKNVSSEMGNAPIPAKWKYIATVQLAEGDIVRHIFEA